MIKNNKIMIYLKKIIRKFEKYIDDKNRKKKHKKLKVTSYHLKKY